MPSFSYRSARLLALACTAALSWSVLADQVQSIDREPLDGTVTLQAGTNSLTVTDAQGQIHNVQLDNVDALTFTTKAPKPSPDAFPWQIQLAHDGAAQGELESINNETATLHLPGIGEVSVPLSHTRSLWIKTFDSTALDRDNEPDNQDTVYLRDKNNPDDIRSVSGQVVALDGTSLTFAFRGQERTINRDRLVGLVFKHAARPTPPTPGTHHRLELHHGQALIGQVRAIGETITLELLSGETIAVPREAAHTLRVVNGRRVDLTRLTPTAEETIPYFSLKLPHRVNTDFEGNPITLYDGKTYERGLAVHSKSRLHYKLRPNAERFQATFGLLSPGGKLGDVTARVLGDGQILWEQDNITAASQAIDIDIELNGVERLVLEVDFGQGQHVGDRAAWCNPRLTYRAQP